MATWADSGKTIWVFDDNKLNFDDWVKENPERETAWTKASEDYQKNPSESKAAEIFGEWITYAHAVEEQYKK